MKNLILAFLLFASTVLSAQTYYCVQIMSTQNPQLLTKEHVEFTGDPAFFEMVVVNNVTYYRVMFVYTDEIEAKVTLDLVSGAGYQYSLICTRTKEQIAKMIPVFTLSMVNPDNQ